MIGLMRDAIGVGLAATQLGVLRRMLVFQVGIGRRADRPRQPGDRVALRGLATAEEGCLSIPGVVVDVERPLFVRARAVDVHGEPLTARGLRPRGPCDPARGRSPRRRPDARPHREDQRKGALRALREGGTYAPETRRGLRRRSRGVARLMAKPSRTSERSEDRLPRHHRVRGDGPPPPRRQPAQPGAGRHPAGQPQRDGAAGSARRRPPRPRASSAWSCIRPLTSTRRSL